MFLQVFFSPTTLLGTNVLTSTLYLQQVLGALIVLIVGAAFARFVKRVSSQLFRELKVAQVFKNTPVEHFLENADITDRIEDIFSNVIFWLVMLVVVQTCVSILGLQPLTELLDRILTYIPRVIGAIIVLFFGLLLAGLVESMIKGAIRSVTGKSARALGKIASYLVMSMAVLVAISELGIASDYIMVLFIGFVATICLGLGLALGLGGQDVVRQLLQEWYDRTRKELKDES